MTEFESKHGQVSTPPYQLYMSFTDMRNFVSMLPADRRNDVQADFDTITASIQGFNIGVKVHERVPYSRIELVDWGAPLAFHIVLYFDPGSGDNAYGTDFHIKVEAELNLMMKMMLGGKVKDALDKIVDTLVDASHGKMPEGFDPSQFDPSQFDPSRFGGGSGV